MPPELIATLRHEFNDSPQKTTAVAVALIVLAPTLEDPPAMLMRQVRDGDGVAIEALGRIRFRGLGSITELSAAARQAHFGIENWGLAIQSLGEIGGPEAIGVLAQLMRGDFGVNFVQSVLTRIGPSVVPELAGLLELPDYNTFQSTVAVLMGLGPEAKPALRAIIPILTAAIITPKRGDPTGNLTAEVTCPLLATLIDVRDASLVPRLGGLLKNGSWRTVKCAADGLRNLGLSAAPTVPDLAAALLRTDIDENTRERLRKCIISFGHTGFSGLLESMQAPGVNGHLVDFLPILDELWTAPDNRETLNLAINALSDGKLAAIQFLSATTRPQEVVPLLSQALLKAQSPTARYAAAMLIGNFGPSAQGAKPALMMALNDPSREVQSVAKEAIEAIAIR